jgi:phage tail sheath protein FI
MNYKTPGVYVEEIAKFPPSVAQVETAIPAFIGYTEKDQKMSRQESLLCWNTKQFLEKQKRKNSDLYFDSRYCCYYNLRIIN